LIRGGAGDAPEEIRMEQTSITPGMLSNFWSAWDGVSWPGAHAALKRRARPRSVLGMLE
jgi:hypothetical protein